MFKYGKYILNSLKSVSKYIRFGKDRQTEGPNNLRASEPCDSWHGKQDPRNSGSLGCRQRDVYEYFAKYITQSLLVDSLCRAVGRL